MKKWIIGMLGVYSLLAGIQQGLACTDFKISSQDGSTLIARSMEFSDDLKSNLRTSTRGRQFNEFAPNGKPGLSWKAQYGYVFLDGFNIDATIDGMNEAGLSFEYLYLPGETQYQNVPAGHESQALSYLRMGDWILGNFKSIEEVRNALANVFVFGQTIPGMGDMVFPLHASIYDTSGKGLVVEFVNGKMNVYDNNVGILTNSPTFDWQVTNLREYVNLSPWAPNPIVIGSLVFAVTGQGSGMKGLPGDSSPPSRFAKIAAMKSSVYQARNVAEALNVAQHIINNVDIPAGFVRAKNKDKISFETTQWTIFKDLTNKVLYYHTYGDTTLHSVVLSQVDFSVTAPRLKMPVADNQVIIDMTKQFLQSKSQ